MPLGPVLGAPGQNGIGVRFRAVVGHDHARFAALLNQHRRLTGDPFA
jgi:hypothetical protein